MKAGNRNEARVRNELVDFVRKNLIESFPIPVAVDETGLIVLTSSLAIADSPDFLIQMPDGTVEAAEIKTRVTAESAAVAEIDIQTKYKSQRLANVDYGTARCNELVPDKGHRIQVLHHAAVTEVGHVWYITASTSAILSVTRISVSQSQRAAHIHDCKTVILPHLDWAYASDPDIPDFDDYGWAKDKQSFEWTFWLWRSWQELVKTTDYKPPAPVRLFKSLAVHSWCKVKGGVDVASHCITTIAPNLRLGFSSQAILRGLCYLTYNGIKLYKMFKTMSEDVLTVSEWRQRMNRLGSFNDLCAHLFSAGQGIQTAQAIRNLVSVSATPLKPLSVMTITPPKDAQKQWLFWSEPSFQYDKTPGGQPGNGINFRRSTGEYEHLRDIHVPVALGKLSSGNGYKQRACILCSRGSADGKSANHRVNTECNLCKVALCREPPKDNPQGKSCFVLFHETEKLERTVAVANRKRVAQPNDENRVHESAVPNKSGDPKRPRAALRRLDLNVQQSPSVQVQNMEVDEEII